MKTAVYLRTARSGQEETDGSRAALQAYAEAHGLDVVAWFADAGVSGLTPFAERAAAAALLAAAAGRFERVLVLRWDRLSRSVEGMTAALGCLEAAGVTAASISEGEMR